MTRSQSHNYEALDPTSKSIRLLTLKRDCDGEIHCTSSVHDLDSVPPFVALSYEWGSKRRLRKTIRLDGASFQIRRNLFSALKVFVDHGWPKEVDKATKYIWIDALCINQRNVKERSHQVGMMAKIYSQAKHVISWLGLADDHSSDWIMQAADEMEIPQGIEVCWYMSHEDATSVARATHWDPDHPVLVHIRKCRMRGTVFNRPYFNRLWIVQEVVLSQQSAVLCGLKSTATSTLARLLAVLDKYLKTSTTFADTTLYKITAFNDQHSILLADRLDIVDSLAWQVCDDARDKINGLAGLLDKSDSKTHSCNFQWHVDYVESRVATITRFLELEMCPISDSVVESYQPVNISLAMGIQPSRVLTPSVIHQIQEIIRARPSSPMADLLCEQWKRYSEQPVSISMWAHFSGKRQRDVPAWVIRDLMLHPSFLATELWKLWRGKDQELPF